ncbi:hypothetical protein B0H16DRAFT_1320819 [Mycena metata]|uniref:SH3 domain-containing protein n=1 Tax=Mycena metata TaxID=1033252 RepID=A0AAD7IPX4_9AGAR|nr:hypothetical protein B0H16DRAFT_1320819 [Mycena metata]
MISSALAHIIKTTRDNLEFLISERHISVADGTTIQDILSKLPNVDRSMVALEQRTQNLLITPPPSTAPSYNQSQIVQAKALWAFNEGRDSSDLSFRAGDTIEIVAETNADWWTGRHNGKQGLFPSNYVEKLPPSGPSPYQARESYSGNPSMPSFPSQPAYQPPSGPPYQPPSGPQGPYSGPGYQPLGPGYQPPGQGYQPPGGGYQPPSGGYQPAYNPPSGPLQDGPYNSYNGPPPMIGKPTQAPPAAAPAPQQPPKKGKFGNLGNTLAQSAVGGVGFGAGSAVGSGIVNAIF